MPEPKTEEIKKEIKDEKQGAKEYREKAREADKPWERRIYEGMAKDEEHHAKQLISMEKSGPNYSRRKSSRRSLASKLLDG